MRFRSLRRQYVAEAAISIALLVAAFALVALGAVTARLLIASRADAATVGASLLPHGHMEGTLERDRTELVSFNTAVDPHVEIHTPSGQVLLSSNQRGPLPAGAPGLRLVSPPVYRVVLTSPGWSVTVDWPLSPTFDLLHDLVLLMAAAAFVAAVAGAYLGRWTIHRLLRPVQAMTDAARSMRVHGRDLRMPKLTGSGDEFEDLGQTLTELLQDLEARRLRDRVLLSHAAHELRTPLQVLDGNLRLVSGRALSTIDRTESLQAMRRAVDQMARLTRELLELEHAATQEPRREPTNIAALLQEMAEDARALAPGRRIEVDCRLEEAVLDREGLRRALWALLENALAYSGEDAAVWLRSDRAGTKLRFMVEDSGPGIPEAERQHVFERFYRGSAGTERPGTGLGLSIVQALATAQGGTVTIEPASPHGTLAIVSIPVDEGDIALGTQAPTIKKRALHPRRRQRDA